MNSYEEKQQAKRDRLEQRAVRQANEAQATIDKARGMASVIPLGQPILQGHHSEGRDRRYRARIHDTFGKGFAKLDQAKETASRAAAVGSGGISSDDPDAIAKLTEKLAGLEQSQATMKAVNAAIRKHKAAGHDAQLAALLALKLTPAQAAEALKPDFCQRIGFPSYALQNGNAEISRVRKRIAALQAASTAADVEKTGAGYTYREDVDDNRIHFVFEGKPSDDVRAILKRHAFKWSPSRGAWVRQLNGNGRYAGKAVCAQLEELAKTS